MLLLKIGGSLNISPITIQYYLASDGKAPYRIWFNSLRNFTTQQIIDARLTRVERGLLGDSKSIGNGVFELRFKIGSGYRISFGKEGNTIILLLCGGDKKTQKKDIKKAKQYWGDYTRRKKL